MPSYKEKLLNPRWQKKKTDILIRDEFTCKSCSCTTRTLHVHHLEYLNIEPWEYPNDMLITLCDLCHEREQERNMLEQHLSTTLKMKGFLISDLLALSCKIDTDKSFTETLLRVLRNMQNG